MSVLPVRRSCLDRRHNKRLLAVRAAACPPSARSGARAPALAAAAVRKLVEDSGSRPGYEGSTKNICRSLNVNSQKSGNEGEAGGRLPNYFTNCEEPIVPRFCPP
jgi:hypothetical protein